mmetsp:Transcript_27598/g.79403  ORF Transcript_27598/g.79403 Transcript_27598/m.79403 type:complete len:258 (-) Transcript_27598:1175-1948(-)
MSGKMVSLCIVLSLLAAVFVLLPSAVLAQSSTRVQAISRVVPATAGSLPYLFVVGGIVAQGKSSLSVQNYGPGSVSLTIVDEDNNTLSAATIAQDDSLTSQPPFDASNELTFILAAENGTEVFRQTVKNDLTYTFAPEANEIMMLKLDVTTNNVLRLTLGNQLTFDLVATMERQGEPVDGSGTVIQPRASPTSSWLQLTFLQRLAEGDDFYVSMVPKDEGDGTGVVGFAAITYWRPFANADRRRRLNGIGGMARVSA